MLNKDRRHLSAVADLGCCICGKPAEIHHVRHFGEKRKHSKVIPLCPEHHRLGSGAIHSGRASWEFKHGAEDDWLEWVKGQM